MHLRRSAFAQRDGLGKEALNDLLSAIEPTKELPFDATLPEGGEKCRFVESGHRE